MDVLGVNQKKLRKQGKTSTRKGKDVKVVYISSPMKVKTSASEFRATVQELTGRHSDVTRLMEINNNCGGETFYQHGKFNNDGRDLSLSSVNDGDFNISNHNHHQSDFFNSCCESESPTESESFLEHLEPNMEGGFTAMMMQSNFFHESALVEMFRSFE